MPGKPPYFFSLVSMSPNVRETFRLPGAIRVLVKNFIGWPGVWLRRVCYLYTLPPHFRILIFSLVYVGLWSFVISHRKSLLNISARQSPTLPTTTLCSVTIHDTAHAPLLSVPNLVDSHMARNFSSETAHASLNDSSGLVSRFLVLIRKLIKLSFKNSAHPTPPCPSKTEYKSICSYVWVYFLRWFLK